MMTTMKTKNPKRMKSRVRTSTVVVHNDHLLVFLAVDPTSGREYLFLPGGKVEAHETAPEAAERETFEETGFRVETDPMSATEREYFFMWDGEDYDCLTIFYRARLNSPLQASVKDADYNKGAVWIPLERVKEAFSYSEEILSAVTELIEKSR